MSRLADMIARARATGSAVARVTLVQARGSTPREAGAFMLVTAGALAGTIGGGRLEWDCVQDARALLASGGASVDRVIALGPEIGQCCGGAVTARIERLDDASMDALLCAEARARQDRPALLLFGAGHVGRALARTLALLPLRLIWIDARAEEFGDDVPDGVEVRISVDWEGAIASAPAGAGTLVLTQSHALDALIVAAALERGDFRYVGLIGSKTKRRRFEAGFRDLGIAEDRIATLVCPIGDRGIRDKRPEIIAALVAAEIVERLLHPAQSEPS
ncbi:xanthine dehydrogenase accessory protein XdhC [Gluconacetobacter asukensis]|uniref:Xanthine dehydrogenase accessory protein XdhC n=1 Tax=Gluconacetobacter asukensis TaxID=1017181 RepID=A0A7W4J283_9PROT|nr:xanthine dehydrogenase accessory protein XdhC [Gluconacetobacter asukensis]MBB2173360.1 xanthine dehydrogenase accessory protein XdhC [Gluconacetobacter asukensis]